MEAMEAMYGIPNAVEAMYGIPKVLTASVNLV